MAGEDRLVGLAKGMKQQAVSPLLPEAPPQEVKKSDGLDGLAQQMASERDASFRLSLNASRGAKPDAAAEVHKMSQATGLPAEVVERQSDLVRQNLEDEQILNALHNAPRTRDFLAQGDNLKISKDDVAHLSGLEWLMGAAGGGFKEGTRTVRSSALNFESIFSPLSAEKEQELRALREADENSASGLKNFGADGWFENAVVEASRQLPILWNTVKAGGAGAVVGAGAGAMTALIAGQLGPQAATPEEAVLVPLFTQTGARWGGGANVARAVFELEAGQSYGEFSQFRDDEGNLIEQDVAKVGALVYGGVAAGFEFFSLKKVLETVPGGKKLLGQLTKERVKEAMKDKAFRATLLEFVKNSGKAITAETVTEILQEGSQVFIGELAKTAAPGDFEPASAPEVMQRLTDTFVATLQSMSILGTVGPGTSFVLDNMRAMKAKNAAATMDALADHVANSKVAQRTPDKYLEFIQTVKAETGLQDVYVDAGQFAQYFQSQAIDPDEMAKGLQIEDDLKQAAEAGNALRIPIEQYMTKIANTVHHEALKRSIRFQPQDMTLDEAEAFDANRAEELKRVIDDTQRELAELQEEDRLPRQLRSIRETLIQDREKGGAGFRAEDADAQVRLLLAGAKVLSKESGETVQDWFDRVNPVLNISAAPVSQGGDVLNQGVPNSLIEEAKNFPDAKSFIDSKPFLDGRVRRALYREFLQGKGVQRVSSDIKRGDGIHSPAGPESGAPLYDLTENGVYPEDVYGPNGFRYYATGEDAMDRQAYSIISSVEGNPKASLKVYRAVEQEGKAIQPGDWVTTVRQYAKEHGEAHISGGYKIVSKTVAARDLYTSGDSWLEFGYHPQEHVSGFKPLTAVWEKAQQIKSAIGNQGTFDPKNPDILLQDGANQFFQTVPEGDALVTLHNLSEANLQHADKIGGLAVPSLSIGKETDPLSGFGEVSLVAAPQLVDPRVSKMNKVFNADIYSPRYPNVRYRSDTPALREVNERFKKEAADLGIYSFAGELDAYSFDSKGAEAVRDSTVVQLAYLRSIGKDVKIPLREAQTPTLDLNPKLAEFLDGHPMPSELAANPDFLKEYEKARLNEQKHFVKNTMAEGRTEEQALADYNDLMGDVWYDEGKPAYRVLRTLIEEFDARKEDGKPDRYAARTAVGEAVNAPDVRPGFEQFAEKIFNQILKDERIVSDLTDRNGEYRLLPHTLDNVVREMKRHLNDGEGFNYGVGSIRAVVAKQFKSISELKNERNAIVTPEKMEALKEEANNGFSDLAEKFRPYVEHASGDFGWYDRFSEHLKEMATRGTKAVMDDYYGGYIPADLLEEAKDFLNKLRNMATEYFEVKVQRAVALNEFAAALVPDNVSQETLAVLKKNGITDVVKYQRNKGVSGNEGRAVALKQLKKTRPDLFFQEQGGVKGSIEFANSATVITLFKAADFSTFLHESGHLFMREMGAIVASGRASAQLQADYKALTDYVGGDISTREAQEKLARAFEAYLREGKAPSVKLTSAFQRFRDWLMRIYKEIKKLNVELTDEVRGVFDRLLASEAELAEAQRFYRSKASLLDLVNPTPEQRADLEKKRQAAEGTALDKQVAKNLRAYFDAIGGQAQLRKDAEAAVSAMPVYKLIEAATEAGGLDLDAMRRTYGKDAVEAIGKQHPGLLKRRGEGQNKAAGFYTYDETENTFKIVPDAKPVSIEGFEGFTHKTAKGYAVSEIRSGKVMGRGSTLKKAVQNAIDAVKAVGEENTKKAIERAVNKGGLSPRFLSSGSLGAYAAQFEFTSPDAAFEALTRAVKKKDAVKNRTADLVREKEADIRRDLSTQERMGGEEAVHNDASLTYLLAQANILLSKLERARTIRPEQLEARLYKQTAQAYLQKKKVREATRYDLYAKAEQKFAKEALRAAEKGDFNAAYDFKVRQALNHALVQEAIRLRDEKAEIENYFKLKTLKSKLKNVENSFMEVAVDLAQHYGFIPEDALPLKTKDAALRLKELDEVLAAQTPDFILRKERPAGFKTYRDMTYQQFREVVDTVKAVINFGNDTLKSAEAGEQQSRQAVIDDSVARMQTLKDRVNSKLNQLRDESSRASGAVGLADNFVADATMVQFLSDWMDAFQFVQKGTFGPMRTLYNKVLAAETTYEDTRKAIMKDTKDAWDALGKAVQRIHKEHGSRITVPDVPLPEDMRRTKRAYWSGDRMIALLLNTGNAGNLNAIQKGYSFTPAQIQKIASYFTEAELKAIQSIWTATDAMFPALDSTHFAIYNRHIEKVAPQPVTFTSKDGKQVKLDGGYYPLIFDHRLNDRAAQFFEEDMMKNQTQAVVRSTKPEDGATYSRVPGHSLPPLLETSVWFRHVSNVVRYTTHARILRDMNVITRDAEWSKEAKKRAGHEHYKALRSWLQYQANPGRTENESIFDWSRGVMTAVALGFKNSVGLKQRADVLKGIRAIGKDDLGKGWVYVAKAYRQLNWRASVLGTSHNDSWQDIIKRSAYVRTRDGNIDREISDLRDRLKPLGMKRVTIAGKEFTARDIQDAAYFWIKMNDRAAVSVIWTAAYNKFIAENADPKQAPEQQDKAAIAYADGIIQDTQASSLKAELSAIQRGEFKGLSRGAIKLFTAFMTESLKYGNRSMQNYRAWSQGSITTKEFLHHIMLEQVITPWTALMLGVAGKFGDLPEWWEFLMEPVYSYLSWIPIVRDVTGWWQHGIDKVGDTTFTGALKPIAEGLKSAGLFVIGEEEFDDMLWNVGELLQAVYKVPALNFVKDVKNAIESIEGV